MSKHSSAPSVRQIISPSDDGCLVLRQSNTSFADWENIPETVLLNGTFGFVLFIIFVILTHLAWNRYATDKGIHMQSLINFLYGYRDPELWYVIPRYEFLRPQERHHQHDLDYPYIYVPPKLPLANPIEAFVYESDVGQENNLSTTISKSTERSPVIVHETEIKAPQDGRRDKESTRESSKQSNKTNSSLSIAKVRTSSSGGLGQKKSSRLAQSFIYPSLLTAENLQASYLSRKLNRFFSSFSKITDADVIYARGIDAYEYLLFQRHLILIMVITNILCLGVILPIHWFAGTTVDPETTLTTSFQRTTIKNMSSKSHFHWAHIICSIIITISAIRIMGSYRDSITTRNETQLSRRTLLIGNIPKGQRDRAQISRIIDENFPGVSVEAIQFVYDFSALYLYESYLSSAIVAKNYCRAYKEKYGREFLVHKTDVNTSRYCDGYCRLCSFLYVCCLYWTHESSEPGTEYYAQEERRYREKIAKACDKMVNEPTEYAFVTFKAHKHARRVIQELAYMKQETLGERPSLAFRSSHSRRDPFTAAMSMMGITHKTKSSNATKSLRGSDEAAQRAGKTELDLHAIKFFESANNDSDPLDPKNDPHVRSIRSPHELSRRRASETIVEDRLRVSESHASKKIKRSRSPKSPRSPKLSMKSELDRNKLSKAVTSIDSLSNLQSVTSRIADDSPILWSIRYAPHPDNVEYDDLRYLARVSKYTGILLHLLMIVFFIFITTPNVLLSMLERIAVIRPDRAEQLTGFQGLIINYFSILLQITMTALLPSLMTLISRQIPYEDSSSKNHSVMWKVYLFLVLMVIVMPSIGMSSAQALFVSDIDPKCLFPTDNGSYFINYVVSSTLLSNILELIKPIDILYYYFILWTSRSSAELESGRQFIVREFSVGMQHTSVLLIFAVVMTYCISCPLIAPAGLLYMISKHSVDHYHLYYTYFTKKVDQNMQSTIVIFVKVGLLLMLFQTTVAISLNTGTSYFSLISQIVFWITLAALVFNCFFDCTSRSMPAPVRRTRSKHEFCACFYLPTLMNSLIKLNVIPPKYVSRKL